MELMIATIITALPQACPRYFFGRPTSSIRCEADALAAIAFFCEHADANVISTTAEELRALAEVNPQFYELVNQLIWKVELPLGSYGWKNHFQLLNKHLD